MSRLLQMLKVGATNLFHWDFLIAMLPMVFYGLGFAIYARDSSSSYWVKNCTSVADLAFPKSAGDLTLARSSDATIWGEGGYLEMTGSMDMFGVMLACCCCLYFVLKGREFLTKFTSFNDRYFYVQIAQIVVAIPSIFIASMLILWFFLPHEGL
ncbi:MAG: hypothetical protein Q7U37_04340 [Gallionella sp.]|nr:hypothetical protein [Gallionella sp.]